MKFMNHCIPTQSIRGRVVIAIDGTASSGKGSLARSIADTLNFVHLDTGLLYRIFAAKFAERYMPTLYNTGKLDIKPEDKDEILNHLQGDASSYSTEAIGNAASIIARNVAVREALLVIQQEFVRTSECGVVLDGRDTATVVCPDADIKIFVTAHASVRALRRYKQLRSTCGRRRTMYRKVLSSILERDIRDSCRKVAPLRRSEGSLYLNNSHLNREESLQELMKKIKTFL
ncbi:(d)CMP kinase [Candidatus Anaplasma sp. TIGMIC]|uniref:(d)CMP kinase n=1 Tax=Candidatus Anaplasma sp. TIGMIC TaxID=3020713 RepID=UPI00232C9F5F|nr:(d)CMP kinase [Candidatus Anaplasma sp. TIGMIC]MDB1135212.1 (d)CMP kinase [Candidatus Anaplasma sp. TIGMIC]